MELNLTNIKFLLQLEPVITFLLDIGSSIEHNSMLINSIMVKYIIVNNICIIAFSHINKLYCIKHQI